MTQSHELFQRSLQVAPGGVHSPVRAFRGVGGEPIFFERAEGPYLYSVDGKRYIDFCMSFGPLILGHRDPEVAEVVHRAVDTAWSFGACEPYSLSLAEYIKKQIPFVEKLRFVSSGTEAVMSALRVARAATGKSKILKFDGCYHGHADSLLVKSGSGLAGEATSDSAGVSPQVARETLVAPLDDDEAFARILTENIKDLAAVIIEPLPANYGLLIQRQEFLRRVRELCKKHQVLFICDEVISGFRVGFGGMASLLDLKPDLVTYGKVVGGGFPVGCFAGRRDLLDLVAPLGPVYQAGTLSANPIGMQAGLATLSQLIEKNVYERLHERGSRFFTTLTQGFHQKQIPLTVAHFESIFWIHKKTDEPIRRLHQIPQDHKELFARFFHACLLKGLYLAPSGYEVGFLSLAHSESVLQEAAEIIVQSAHEVYA